MAQQGPGDLERVDNKAQQESDGLAHALERGAQSKPRSLWWMAAISLMLSLMTFLMFQCMCGLFSLDALPFAAASFLIACCGWVFSKDKFPRRLWHIAAVISAGLLLCDLMADILWFGHQPLLR